MQINEADVAELVDARDLKSSAATEDTKNSCKTSAIDPAEMHPAPAGLQNIPRTLSDLRSFLHGYRIKAGEDVVKAARASIIIRSIDTGVKSAMAKWAARELAELDPSLSWLPGWKPRVVIQALRKGDGPEAVPNGEG